MTVARKMKRITAMSGAELHWRASSSLRSGVDRAAATLRRPRWRRVSIGKLLGRGDTAEAVRRMCARRDWHSAHLALAQAFIETSRFVLAPGLRDATVARITRMFPASIAAAAARADRIVAGEFDVLGYRGLRFGDGDPDEVPNWHRDPVLGRTAPIRFWSKMPFLDPSVCGDHKVIWELNRHQHLLTLGRAAWLTGRRRYRNLAIAHLRSWITENPPLLGINWASMLELAFRVLSWTWAVHFFAEDAADDSEPWLVDLLVALDRQLVHIEQNLSYYFSPNTHLLGEGLALYVSGLALPMLRGADRYAATGRRVLVQEIGRQITADGGHVERSTHYHRYALDFYLLALAMAKVTDDPVADEFETAARRLGVAARLLADDSGHLPHIGDDDGGMLLPICGRGPDDISDSLSIAGALTDRPDLRVGPMSEEAYWMLGHPHLVQLLDRAMDMPPLEAVGSAALPATGYYISRSAAGDHLVVDAGPLGFANGGHAHADALSLTLSVGGVPLLIDAGTGLYTADPVARDLFRSTALHNTATVDGQWQSEVAGPFHWSRGARTTAQIWRTNPGFDYLEASHDGYAPLEHRRHVLSLHGDLLIVADCIEGEGDHDVAVHWHLDPRWNAQVAGRRAVLQANGHRAELAVSRGDLHQFIGSEDGLGWHSPVYGRIEQTRSLRVTTSGALPIWIVSVFGLDASNPVLLVDPAPVQAQADRLQRGVAVRISRVHSNDLFGIGMPTRPFQSATSDHGWRLGVYETDARVLYCRASGADSRIAVVDASFVRSPNRQPIQLRATGGAPSWCGLLPALCHQNEDTC